MAQAQKQKNRKLMANWRGPYRVSDVISDHIFEVEHLLSRKKSEVHHSRLKFYCDNDVDCIIPFELVVQREDDCDSNVESIVDCKYVPASTSYAFKVKWHGYDDAENTWEDPVQINILASELVHDYVQRIRVKKMRTALIDLLDLDLGH